MLIFISYDLGLDSGHIPLILLKRQSFATLVPLFIRPSTLKLIVLIKLVGILDTLSWNMSVHLISKGLRLIKLLVGLLKRRVSESCPGIVWTLDKGINWLSVLLVKVIHI